MKMCVDGLRKDKIPQAVEQPPRKKSEIGATENKGVMRM
jgi:hypothetical protein